MFVSYKFGKFTQEIAFACVEDAIEAAMELAKVPGVKNLIAFGVNTAPVAYPETYSSIEEACADMQNHLFVMPKRLS